MPDPIALSRVDEDVELLLNGARLAAPDAINSFSDNDEYADRERKPLGQVGTRISRDFSKCTGQLELSDTTSRIEDIRAQYLAAVNARTPAEVTIIRTRTYRSPAVEVRVVTWRNVHLTLGRSVSGDQDSKVTIDWMTGTPPEFT